MERTPLSLSRWLIYTSLYCLALVILIEVASRSALISSFKNKISFKNPASLWLAYYPELNPILENAPKEKDATFDLLILGGSVARDWKPVGLPAGSRIHNAGFNAHSSRDALFKMKLLSDRHFDAIVYYEAINEFRANNIARKDFEENYGHYSWYRELNVLNAHPELAMISFPFAIHHLVSIELAKSLGLQTPALPRHQPPHKLLREGRDIKTENPFAQNLREIAEVAKEQNSPLFLASFASYVDPDYSFDGFKKKQLDYAGHFFPIELWGEKANVIAGIKLHNQVLARVAQEKGVTFLDVGASFPQGKIYFHDICHLTPRGYAELDQRLLKPILESHW